jgi:hypothetical protein
MVINVDCHEVSPSRLSQRVVRYQAVHMEGHLLTRQVRYLRRSREPLTQRHNGLCNRRPLLSRDSTAFEHFTAECCIRVTVLASHTEEVGHRETHAIENLPPSCGI